MKVVILPQETGRFGGLKEQQNMKRGYVLSKSYVISSLT